MTSFEGIVRPFQSLDVTPPQSVPNPTQVVVPNVVLAIGEVGTVKTFTGSFSITTTEYMITTQKEKSRTTTTKHITNPSDPSQFVDVEYIDALTSLGVNGQETTTKYKRTP